jgi:hypothetical protein
MKKLLLALVIFFGVERFCYFQTDGFILSKMVLKNVSPTSGPSETLHFIGAGKQFYAFETADHQYVVKFMKFSRRRALPWLEKLPFFHHYLAERAKRLYDIEYSSQLALQHLSSEAALASYPLPQNLILIDKLDIAHRIATAQTKFIVQKKAVPFTVYFEQNPSDAQTLISSYIKTVSSQCKKGICNLDPLIERNYGVVDNQIILMDIGSLLAHPKLNHKAGMQHEIFIELLPLRQWLQNNYPQHVVFFDQSFCEIISSDKN